MPAKKKPVKRIASVKKSLSKPASSSKGLPMILLVFGVVFGVLLGCGLYGVYYSTMSPVSINKITSDTDTRVGTPKPKSTPEAGCTPEYKNGKPTGRVQCKRLIEQKLIATPKATPKATTAPTLQQEK